MTRLIVICAFLLAFVDAGGFNIQYGRTQGKYIMSYDNLPVHFDYTLLEKLPIDFATMVWRYQIMNKGDSILALEDGTFNVYLLEGNQWKNLYLGRYSGYNSYSNAFIKDGNLYSIGGYGYWECHSKLIWFDFNVGGWEIVTTYNTPKDLEPLLVAFTDDGIQLLFGEYNDQLSNTTSLSSDIYTLDYSTWEYSRKQYSFTPPDGILSPFKSSINTNEYCITSIKINTYPASLIYKKKNRELRLIQNSDPFDLFYNQLIYTNGDTILKYDPISKVFKGYDILTAWEKGEPVKYNRKILNKGLRMTIILAGLLSIIIFVLYRKRIFFMFKNSRIFSRESDLDDSHPLFSPRLQRALHLLEDAPDEIDSNDLDEIFGISDLPHDLRRVKRSQMLNKLNDEHLKTTGKIMIDRIRQEDDRRYIKYRINRV